MQSDKLLLATILPWFVATLYVLGNEWLEFGFEWIGVALLLVIVYVGIYLILRTSLSRICKAILIPIYAVFYLVGLVMYSLILSCNLFENCL